MGGCWFAAVSGSTITPFLWRAAFPSDVVTDLVSYKNPWGSITNSDLELSGMIAQMDTLVQQYDISDRTAIPLGDNIPAVSWGHRGSVTTLGATGHLLRLNSLHQRHFRYCSKPDFIPGPVNQMADDCSRLWHLSDDELLTHFNLTYPQDEPWRLVQLRPSMHSCLISALRKERASKALLLNEPAPKTLIGESGKLSVPPSASISTSGRSNRSFLFSKFSRTDYDSASSAPAVSLSTLAPYVTSWRQSGRRYPAWGPKTVIHDTA